MSNLGVLLILISISAIPAAAVFVWFRLARYPFSPPLFFVSLFAGATSLFVALFLQFFIAGTGVLPMPVDRTGLLLEIFFRIAFTEELSRLLLLAILFRVFSRLDPAAWAGLPGLGPPGTTFSGGIPAGTMGRASGLVAGLGFALLESTVYGAADPLNALLRVFTSAPLHAACGSRVGSSVTTFRENRPLAVLQFLSAVAIHGIYNFLLIMPGRIFPWVAVFVALSALASSVQALARGMRGDDGKR